MSRYPFESEQTQFFDLKITLDDNIYNVEGYTKHTLINYEKQTLEHPGCEDWETEIFIDEVLTENYEFVEISDVLKNQLKEIIKEKLEEL